MKKISKKILAGGILMVGLAGMTLSPAMAGSCKEELGDGCVDASILSNSQTSSGEKCYCDTSGDGEGIYYILNIILTVLTYGVGVAGTIGLVVVGIMYASSGGNPAQMEKTKKRILEIAIGLVAYAVLYAGLQWLIPGGLF